MRVCKTRRDDGAEATLIVRNGNVGCAAVGADCAVMDGKSAVGTDLLKHLTAECAELAADRIRLAALGTDKRSSVDNIRMIRRTMRIRAKANHRYDRLPYDFCYALRLAVGCLLTLLLLPQVDAEFFRQLLNHCVVEFRSVALLEHRQSRLLAADLSCQYALRKLRLTASFFYSKANLWI